MRRLLRWPLAALGGLALYRALKRRRRPGREAPSEPHATDARAEELRRKLAESRALVHEREEFEDGETSVDRADPDEADPDARRRDVHARGRAAADEMRASGHTES